MTYSTFVSIVGQERIEQFTKLNQQFPSDVLNDDFITLFKIWKYYNEKTKPKKCPNKKIAADKINVIQDIVLVHAPKSPLKKAEPPTLEKVTVEVLVHSSRSPIKSPELQTNEKVTVEILPYPPPNSPIKDLEASLRTENVGVLYEKEEPKPSTSKKCLIESKLFSNFLTSPETPKRKGKRNIERFPFAITSKKYQEMFEKKRAIKEKEEEEKKERKRKREEKLTSKKQDMDKQNDERKKKREETSKRKNLSNKKKENVKRCFVCQNGIKTGEIQCDDCKNYFHRLCVPKKHKQYISDEGDEDEIFLCHICYQEDDGESDTSEEFEERLETDPEVDELFTLYKKHQREN